MKFNKPLPIVAVLIAALGIQTSGYSQTYLLTEPLNGLGVSVYDTVYIGNLPIGGTVSDTVVINPSALTIEQSGTIYIPACNPTLSQTETESFTTTTLQNFPLPPIIVTNVVTGDLTVGMNFSGGSFSFDTGPQSLEWNGSTYTFGASTTVQLPLSFSYSLDTGGQTYSGTDQNVLFNFPLTLSEQVDTANYPTSIALNPAPYFASSGRNLQNATIASFTAEDGFQSDIVVNVPEPASWAVFGCTLLAIRLFRQRQP